MLEEIALDDQNVRFETDTERACLVLDLQHLLSARARNEKSRLNGTMNWNRETVSSTAPQGDKRGSALAAVGFFVAVSVWLTWPLAPRFGSGLSSSPDSLLNAWALAWNFHILPRDPFSLFDANIFAPRPDTLAYSEHMMGITVLVGPVFWATNNLVLTYNVAFFGSFVLSGLGMFLLTRELTKNGWAALVAGTIFLAAPYRFQHLVQLQLLTYQWFPFVFWCLYRFLRGGGLGWLGGVVIFSLLQILSCNYYAMYLVIAVLLFGVLLCLETARASSTPQSTRSLPDARLTKSTAMQLVLGAICVGVVALPFFIPYERNRDRGFYRRYEDTVHYSATPSEYLTPSAFNDAPHIRWLPRGRKALFPGFVAVLLAAAGAVAGARERRLFWQFGVALLLVGFVLSLGPETRVLGVRIPLPYRLFQLHFPGFNGMRVPARIATLALVGGSMLAAFAARALLDHAGRFRNAAGVGLVALLLFEYQTSSLDRVVPEALPIPAAHRWLATAKSPGAVLVLPIHEGEEIVRESSYMYYSTSHFKPLVNGYSGWWPNDYWELVGRLRHFPTSRILRFLRERAPVRYVVIHYSEIPEPRRRQLESAMERYRERIPERFRDGEIVVYEIVS